MPIKTPHFGLSAFTFGDVYLSALDKKRFTIIDTQFSFLTSQIGDGIIDGWTLSDGGSLKIDVAPGTGIIDGFATNTFGTLSSQLQDNKRYYVYLRRTLDAKSEYSAFSDLASVTYTDVTAPQPATALTLVDKDYNFIQFSWTPGVDIDIAYYKIYRSLNGVTYSEIGQSTTTTYTDSTVDYNTTYYYKVYVVDNSDLTSVASAPLTEVSLNDARLPGDPTNVHITNGHEAIEVVWDEGVFLVDHYLITIQPIDTNGANDGASIVNTTTDLYWIETGLINGQFYKITVQSVSPAGISSSGVVVRGQPVFSYGSEEFSSFSVSESVIDDSFNLQLVLSWTLVYNDPYNVPSYYTITVSDGQSSVASYYDGVGETAAITGFTLSTGVESGIVENTAYTITIESVNSDGIKSAPYVVRHTTSKYSPPLSVANLFIDATYTIVNKFVKISWNNSVSDFSYNKITVIKKPADTPMDVGTWIYVTTNENVGNAETYTLDLSDVENEFLYTANVTAVDSFGNESIESSYTYAMVVSFETTYTVAGVDLAGVRPPVPINVSALSGNDQVSLYWDEAESDYIASYKIWRSSATANTLSFTNIGTVSATSLLKFNDYTVDNGESYFYFITSVDIFSQESPNPSEGFYSYTFTVGEPRSHIDLVKPLNLTAIAGPYDVDLFWDLDGDSIDGYAVFRSINSESDFVQIGSADALTGSYTDTNALTYSGTYRYMVRKYRNDGEIIVTTSKTAPVNAIKLGMVLVVGGVMTIYPDYYIIKNLTDPILDEFKKQMLVPTHLYESSIDDRRIRLGDSMVISEWTTSNYQTYTTVYDIRNTTNYIVYLNGVQSAFSSAIDTENGTITFQQPIFSVSATSTETAPTLSVVFTGIEEVTGVLPADHISQLMANKVTKGKIAIQNMPQVDHFGRYREPAYPVKVTMTRKDRFTYEATTPTGITFYDVLKTNDNRLVAGASDGLRISQTDDMSLWDIAVTSSYAFTLVFYSSFYQIYFAVSKNEIYYSDDLVDWLKTSGISDVNVVRKITEDMSGNIFVSTDAGIFKLNTTSSIRYVWFQIDSDDTYALYYNTGTNQLVASKSEEILVSSDAGTTWTTLTSKITFPIFDITYNSGYYHFVSNNTVWRCSVSGANASEVAVLNTVCRRIAVFNDDVFITTDDGIYRATGDIYFDSILEFEQTFNQLSRNGNIPVVLGLSVADSRMWLTMDERIYSVTSDNLLMLHSDVSTICPTIYRNGVETNMGVSYSTSNKVTFDYPVPVTDTIEIVSSYVDFYLINGGWVDTKYDAEVTLVINDVEQPLASGVASTPNDAANVSLAVQEIVVPFFNGRNSNFAEASKWLQLVVQTQDSISTTALLTPTATIDSATVVSLFEYLDLFKVNLDPELWSGITIPAMIGTATTSSQIVFEFDAVTGKITIPAGVRKYTNVAANIKDVGLTGTGSLTHREIEDKLENINSGLSLSMANVQQSNIVRMGNFEQRVNPFWQSALGLNYQSVFTAPCDDWYDKFNSTVDYKIQLDLSPTMQSRYGETVYGSFSIEYPSDVLFVSTRNEVWVCGYGGIIAINATTFECSKVIQTDWYFYNMHLNNGYVYTLAEDGLYQISTTDLTYSKNVDIDLKENATGVLQFGDTTFLSTASGLFSKRSFEPDWREIATVNNAFLKAASELTFCVGQDPSSSTTSLVFYSHQGIVWNRSSQFVGYSISGAAQQYSNVYYSSDQGLLVEDVGNLFGTGNSGSTIQPIDLDGDGEPDNFVINAVDADDTKVVAARSDGVYYNITGNIVSSSGQSLLQTIHKVKIVNGNYWFFAGNLVEVQGQSRLIQISTGKSLI